MLLRPHSAAWCGMVAHRGSSTGLPGGGSAVGLRQHGPHQHGLSVCGSSGAASAMQPAARALAARQPLPLVANEELVSACVLHSPALARMCARTHACMHTSFQATSHRAAPSTLPAPHLQPHLCLVTGEAQGAAQQATAEGRVCWGGAGGRFPGRRPCPRAGGECIERGGAAVTQARCSG